MNEQATKRTALLLGASGLVGSHCLEWLLRDATYSKVVVAVRKKLPLINEKLEQHTVDFDQLDQYPEIFAVNDVFCCLGTTMAQAGSREAFKKVDYQYPLAAAKLALAHGAEQYLVISSIGANKNDMVFYTKVKGMVEEELKQLPFAAIHIFRPSLLLGEREKSRFGEQMGERLLKAFSFAMKGPLKKYRGIEAGTVAYAMMACAKQNDKGIHVYESDQIQAIFDQNNPH